MQRRRRVVEDLSGLSDLSSVASLSEEERKVAAPRAARERSLSEEERKVAAPRARATPKRLSITVPRAVAEVRHVIDEAKKFAKWRKLNGKNRRAMRKDLALQAHIIRKQSNTLSEDTRAELARAVRKLEPLNLFTKSQLERMFLVDDDRSGSGNVAVDVLDSDEYEELARDLASVSPSVRADPHVGFSGEAREYEKDSFLASDRSVRMRTPSGEPEEAKFDFNEKRATRSSERSSVKSGGRRGALRVGRRQPVRYGASELIGADVSDLVRRMKEAVAKRKAGEDAADRRKRLDKVRRETRAEALVTVFVRNARLTASGARKVAEQLMKLFGTRKRGAMKAFEEFVLQFGKGVHHGNARWIGEGVNPFGPLEGFISKDVVAEIAVIMKRDGWVRKYSASASSGGRVTSTSSRAGSASSGTERFVKRSSSKLTSAASSSRRSASARSSSKSSSAASARASTRSRSSKSKSWERAGRGSGGKVTSTSRSSLTGSAGSAPRRAGSA